MRTLKLLKLLVLFSLLLGGIAGVGDLVIAPAEAASEFTTGANTSLNPSGPTSPLPLRPQLHPANPALAGQVLTGTTVVESGDVGPAAAPVIEVWYGLNQTFGALGEPQRWVNILGRVVTDTAQISSLSYTLNGGASTPLNLGPDEHRLDEAGDFNIDLAYADLDPGSNTIVITAVDIDSNSTQETVTVQYDDGNVWALPYSIDWSTVTDITDVVQPVDGLWGLAGSGVRVTGDKVGYDRLLDIGDINWTDYEIEVPVTVHSIQTEGLPGDHGPPAVGLLMRWTGHFEYTEPPYQPNWWFDPIGGLGWARWLNDGATGDVQIVGRGGEFVGTPISRKLDLNVTYIFKMRVETLGSESYYRLKIWQQGQQEPSGWDIEGQETSGSPQNGSVLLVAHNVDATFGNVSISEPGVTTYSLTTNSSGSGSITRAPDKTAYNAGETVALTATAASGWFFDSWSGDVDSTNGNNASVTMTADKTVTATFVANSPPTDIALAPSSVAEGQPIGTVVGTLSTTDPDGGEDSHTYSLVDTGSYPDNASFSIVGDTLRTAAVFDYDAKNSYTIRVRSTDAAGLFTEKEFTITVTDALPTINVSKTPNPASVLESGAPVNFTVVVTNTSTEALTLTTLIDSDFGDLDGQGNCSLPQSLATNGGTYTCSFTELISGNFGGPAHQDTVTAEAFDSTLNMASNIATATVTFIDVPSSIQVTKTADPTSVNEPGGSVNYTVTVTNTSTADEVTISSVTDDKFGNIGSGSCSGLLGVYAEGASRTCSFNRSITGQPDTPHTNTITASGTDDDSKDVSDSDSATVTFNNLESVILVDLDPDSPIVPETGGTINYTLRVFNLDSNSASDSVTIDTLSDSIQGSLDGQGTCSLPQAIPPTGVYLCTFSTFVAGDHGTIQPETVTASGLDDDNDFVQDSATAFINFDDDNPDISVTKTANPTSVPENGGDVTFNIEVTNNINELATLNSLTDTVYIDLDGKGNCDVPRSLAANGSYSCSFTEFVTGNASGLDHKNTVWAKATDDEGNSDSAKDEATVSFTNVDPTITVTKSANPDAVTEPGDDVTFTISIKNNSSFETVTLESLTDSVFGNLHGQGDCVADGTETILPGQTYICSFTEYIAGSSGDPNHVNTVIAEVADDDPGSSVSGQDNATVFFGEIKRVFLPLISKPAPTELYVQNDNTGGNVTVIVRQLSGPEVTRCTVPNNQTQKCDHNGDDSHIFPPGIYQVEVNASCGSDTTTKTYGSGRQTTRIFCK